MDTVPRPNGDFFDDVLVGVEDADVAAGFEAELDLVALVVELPLFVLGMPNADKGLFFCVRSFGSIPHKLALIFPVLEAFIDEALLGASLLVCIALTISALVALV
ncbi:MAG: hypothetical protein QXN55_09075 [Candidatus Nitrosotenuis sp.]